MRKILRDPFVLICLGAVIFFATTLFFSLWNEDPSSKLQEAQTSYLAGEQAEAVPNRKAAFNKALSLLLELEKEYSPTFGNGKLFFDIGSLFYQLEEYPHALLYYYRAENLRPRDEKVYSHIEIAQKKLGIKEEKNPSAFKNIFFFHYDFSLPERLMGFFAIGLFSVAFVSLYIWFPRRWIYLLSIIFLLLSVPLLLSLAYTYAFSSLEGVVTQASLLYRDAGFHYSKVKNEPILAGKKVEILDAPLRGQWLKIRTDDGTVGYVPQEALKII